MTKIIAVAMQKGGVGKTTTAINLAAAFGEMGYRVLAVDLDPQCNLTQHAGFDPDNLSPTIYDAFKAEIEGYESNVQGSIYETDEKFHLLPAQAELSLIELALINTLSRERVLTTILGDVVNQYDYILIDCNPSLGLLVVNALTAASSVIIPIQTEYLAARGALMILSSIETVRRKKLNADLVIDGILLTMADTRTTLTRDILAAIDNQYGSGIRIFEPIVKRSVRFAESAVAGQSIIVYDSSSQGAEAYRQIAKQIAKERSMGRKKRGKINLSQPNKPHAGDLEKLFTTKTDVEQASGLVLLALRVDAIQPDPSQPRQTFPQESLQELSESIRQDGVIQPIEVTEVSPNRYLIVHGERRWRAAQMAGLETIPAVVQRRNYDDVTRFVRQLVENIQREDLNDVDRAAGLLRLRDLMQTELNAAQEEGVSSDEPWGTKISWAKVGKRLGYSRQRIHQLIKLLDLPDEIKDDVRDGVLSERDTRIYQGLKPSQQRALHKARLAGDLSPAEVKDVAAYLKANPDKTVYQSIRELQEIETAGERPYDPLLSLPDELPEEEELLIDTGSKSALLREIDTLPDLAPGTLRVDNITRLGYILQHLSRITAQGLPPGEKAEVLRRLKIIQQHVNSLLVAMGENEGTTAK